MPRSRSFVLAALGFLPFLASAVSAQWVPNGATVLPRTGDPYAGSLVVPGMVADDRGGALFVAEDRTTDPHRLLARITNEGRSPAGWPSNAVTQSGLGGGFVASDGNGGAFASVDASAPEGSVRVLYHLLADGSADPAWPAGGRVLAVNPGFIGGAQLAPDGSGGVYAVWPSRVDTGYEIHAVRIDIAGATVAGWPGDGKLLVHESEVLNTSQVEATPAGLCVTGVRNPFADPSSGLTNTFAIRVAPDGSAPDGWSSGAITLPFGDGYYIPVAATPDGSLFYSTYQRRMAHLLPDGSFDPAWPDSGLTLAPDPSSFPGFAAPVSDGAGGCFAPFVYDSLGAVVWRVTHLTSTGGMAPGWPALGARLPIVGSGFLGSVTNVPDGTGGVYSLVTLEPDSAGLGFSSLRACLTSATGQTPATWPANGIQVALAPHIHEPVLGVADGHGGCIAAWIDARDDALHPGEPGLFALGFGPDGNFLAVPDSVAASFGSLTVSPHPARGALHLSFSLASASTVTLDVMDIAGRRVRRLEDGLLAPGQHAVPWDGTDDDGRQLPPGVYLARANAAGVVHTARIVRLD